MSFKLPSIERMREIDSELGLQLGDTVLGQMHEFLQPFGDAYNLVGSLSDDLPPVKYPRTPGYRPEGADNLHNAWAVKSTIKGAKRGRLAGRCSPLPARSRRSRGRSVGRSS